MKMVVFSKKFTQRGKGAKKKSKIFHQSLFASLREVFQK